MSQDLTQPVGRGRTADVYPWGRGRVLKLFHAGWPAEAIELEIQNTRAVFGAGLPVPAVGPVIQVGARTGLVLERVEGISLLDTVRGRPWTFYRYDRLLPEVHAQIHRRSVPLLPCLRRRLSEWIRFGEAVPPEVQVKALNLLENLPRSQQLCHGDFHPGNILLTTGGPVIIDWFDATAGNPLADVAATSLLVGAGLPPDGSSLGCCGLFELGRRWFRFYYLRMYARMFPVDRRQIKDWLIVVAVAMLNRGLPLNQSFLRGVLRRELGRRSALPPSVQAFVGRDPQEEL